MPTLSATMLGRRGLAGSLLEKDEPLSFALPPEEASDAEVVASIHMQQIALQASFGIRAAIEQRKPSWSPVDFTMVNKSTHNMRDGVVALLQKKKLAHLMAGPDGDLFMSQAQSQVLNAVKAKRAHEKILSMGGEAKLAPWYTHNYSVHDLIGYMKGNPSQHMAAEISGLRNMLHMAEKTIDMYMRSLGKQEGEEALKALRACVVAKEKIKSGFLGWDSQLRNIKKHLDARLDRIKDSHVLELENVKASVYSVLEFFAKKANVQLGCRPGKPLITVPAAILRPEVEEAEIEAHPFNPIMETSFLRRDFDNAHAGVMVCLSGIKDPSKDKVVEDLKQKLRLMILRENELTTETLELFTSDYARLVSEVENELLSYRLERDSTLSKITVDLSEHDVALWSSSAERASSSREDGQRAITDFFPHAET